MKLEHGPKPEGSETEQLRTELTSKQAEYAALPEDAPEREWIFEQVEGLRERLKALEAQKMEAETDVQTSTPDIRNDNKETGNRRAA